jgi:hypothetical protein
VLLVVLALFPTLLLLQLQHPRCLLYLWVNLELPPHSGTAVAVAEAVVHMQLLQQHGTTH